MRSLYLLPLLLSVVVAPPSQAARPMITDDARLTDAGACQVETWTHRHDRQQEWWTLPACNPGGNLELTVGGALAWHEGHTDTGATVVQLKTLFRPLETNGYGIGLAVGHASQPGNSHAGKPYFYVPASFSFLDDRLVIHGNLGYTRERENGQTRLTWGIGNEWQLRRDTWLIAESYGQDRGRPFVQFGLRHWIVPGHVQVDTTYGNQLGHFGTQSWFSIGLRLISQRLF